MNPSQGSISAILALSGIVGLRPSANFTREGDILIAATIEANDNTEARITDVFSTPLYLPHNTSVAANNTDTIIHKVALPGNNKIRAVAAPPPKPAIEITATN